MSSLKGSEVRAARDTSSLNLTVWAGAGILAVLGTVIPFLPTGTLSVAGLVSRPWTFGVASGVVALPVAVMMGLDFARAQERTYVPPALRVQVARSLVYGVGTVLVALGLALWSHPPALSRLVELGSDAAWALLLVPCAAVASWAVCFRPRTFTVDDLPSFQEASAALRDTNHFISGWCSDDWKRGPVHGSGDRRWFIIPEYGLFTNLYCLGGIGSGKTVSVIYPMLEQALYKWGGDRTVLYGQPGSEEPVRTKDMRIGVLLLDLKGDNAEHVRKRARAHGRADDVIIIKPGGEWSINPLASGSPQQVAVKLIAALQVMLMSTVEPHPFYKKMQTEFATNALGILQDVLGPGRATLKDLYEFIVDPPTFMRFIEAAKPKASLAWRWFDTQWSAEKPENKLELIKGFRADLSQFVTPELAPTFANSKSNFPGWKSIPNDGRIVVFSMSMDDWGPIARALGIFMMMDFQNQMLARSTEKFKEAGGNTKRLVFCFVDEVWAYMNPELANFTAVSRQARCCTLAAHQSLDQVPPQYRATMIGNFRTPLILGINDPLSCEQFAMVFGKHRVVRRTRSESAGYAGVSHGVLSETVTAKAGGESRSVSFSETESEEYRFSPDDLVRLPKFHAVVQVFDGDVVRLPVTVQLIPGFKALLA